MENKKTKVVIIQDTISPNRNGLFNGLSKHDDIELFLLLVGDNTLDKKWTKELTGDYKKIQVQCSVKNVDYLKNIVKLNYIDLIKKLLQIRPDIIISQLTKQTILAKYVLLFKRTKLIYWSEATKNTEGNKNVLSKFYRRVHKNFAKAFIVPGFEAKMYFDYCGFNTQNRIFYTPNSVDDKFYIEEKSIIEKYTDFENDKRIVFIGSYVENKGILLLISVFNKLKKEYPELELHCVGDGPLKPLVEGEGIINYGYLSSNDLIPILTKTHFFVLPSYKDCNPLAAIEALKLGNILVLSKGVGSYPDIINGNGVIFETGDELGLYNALKELLNKTKEELILMGLKSKMISDSISHKNSAESIYNAITYVRNL